MHVNVSKIEKELQIFNNNIKKYEENIINIYYVLEHSSDYWKDGRSASFYEDLAAEKKCVNEVIGNINSIYNVYSYIQNEYSKIGKKIDINLDKQSKLLAELSSVVESANSLSNSCNNVYNLPDGCSSFASVKYEAANVKRNLFDLKAKLISKYEQISRIENAIFSKISKIDINIVKENYNDYLKTGSNVKLSKAYIGKENLEEIINKANTYIDEQCKILLEFQDISERLKAHYVSKNSGKITSLFLQSIDNINTIIRIFGYKLDILSEVIHSREMLVDKYISSFKSMGDNNE